MIEKIDTLRLSSICDEVPREPVTVLTLTKKLNEVIELLNQSTLLEHERDFMNKIVKE